MLAESLALYISLILESIARFFFRLLRFGFYFAVSPWHTAKRCTMRWEELMSALDWSQCPAVESSPEKVSGAWVFRGTRVPVATVFENLEAGATIEDPSWSGLI
jgi:hypothetical protein